MSGSSSEERDYSSEEPEDQEPLSEDDQEIQQKDVKNDKVKRKQKKLQKDVEKFKKDQENRGIIYISKVPPFMKPEKVRFLMSQYGDVDRIYLTPESEDRRNARKKRGGSKKICFIDGWVEFKDKSIAKRVALTLNGTQVGGKKRNFHADFIWNIRYLPKFKWNHLTEHKRQREQTRQDRVRTVLSEAKRENNLYMKSVDKAKMISAMEAKKQEAKKEQAETKRTESLARKQLEDLRSKFKQRETIEDVKPVKQTANIKLLQKVMRPEVKEQPPKKRAKLE